MFQEMLFLETPICTKLKKSPGRQKSQNFFVAAPLPFLTVGPYAPEYKRLSTPAPSAYANSAIVTQQTFGNARRDCCRYNHQ